MSNIANIVVFDGQAVPVSHTFIGESVAREGKTTVVATYKEAAAGVPDEAQGRITLKRTRLPSGVMRQSVRVEIPVMEAINGQNASGYTAAPKVAYVDAVEVVSYASKRSIIANRRSVRQLAINVSGNVSTSVAAVTTGPVPELFDTLITPT